jgi:hypothetical protein
MAKALDDEGDYPAPPSLEGDELPDEGGDLEGLGDEVYDAMRSGDRETFKAALHEYVLACKAEGVELP